ncbi:MAG: hypothetical protein K2X54_09845 [Methylobacterium organophilum]|nr:hypothetical protein [Methylobacterium organophilum]
MLDEVGQDEAGGPGQVSRPWPSGGVRRGFRHQDPPHDGDDDDTPNLKMKCQSGAIERSEQLRPGDGVIRGSHAMPVPTIPVLKRCTESAISPLSAVGA